MFNRKRSIILFLAIIATVIPLGIAFADEVAPTHPGMSKLAKPTGYIINVSSTSDSTAACANNIINWNCPSLRSAVILANTSPGSAIVLVHGVTYTLSIFKSGLNDATTGDLNITADTTIDYGNTICFSNCVSTIQGTTNWNDDIINIAAGVNVHISGVTIKNGKTTSSGGGIYQGACKVSRAIE